MTGCTWSYKEWTPYEVLRVPSNASVGDIRSAFKKMALHTHPDKQHSVSNAAANPGSDTATTATPLSTTATAFIPFHAVKEASEILLDPFLRASYDAELSHALVREVGAISDTFSLTDDFQLVATSDTGDDARVRVYQCECRCGGVYEVVLFDGTAAAASVAGKQRKLRCECDCCSLVVEVTVD